MSTPESASPPKQPASRRPPGRLLFWAGVGACLLGLILVVVQFTLKRLFVPWYSPALATFGALLMLGSLTRQRSTPRVVSLVLIAGFAGLQWYFLGSLMRLPAYEGPAQAGKKLPAFQTAYADGRPFSNADLGDGSRRVLAFFRGRW